MQHYAHNHVVNGTLCGQSAGIIYIISNQQLTPPYCLNNKCLEGCDNSVFHIFLSLNINSRVQHRECYRYANVFGIPFLPYTHA